MSEPIIIQGSDWAVRSKAPQEEVNRRLTEAGIVLVALKTGTTQPFRAPGPAGIPGEER
jgi:hypothetical protein